MNCHLQTFFGLERMVTEDPVALKNLIDNSTEIVRSLQVLGLPVKHWDTILVHVVASKLDNETHKHWELKLKKDELPTFQSLAEFLESRWQSLEMITNSKSQQQNPFQEENNKVQQSRQVNRQKVSTSTATNLGANTKNINCYYCGKQDHTITNCESKNYSSTNGAGINSTVVVNLSTNQKRVLLATAIVNIIKSSGETIPARALIDQASEQSITQTQLAKRLELLHKAESIPIIGVGQKIAQEKTSLVKAIIESRLDPTFKLEVEFCTMETITAPLPTKQIERKKWPHLKGLKLADENYHQSAPIQLLLGADVFEEIILDGIIKKIHNSPTAMNSTLGWLMLGKVEAKHHQVREIKVNCLQIGDNTKLENTLKAFWEMEEVPTLRKLTINEQCAENIFSQNISRTISGRYQVPLLFDPSKSSKVLGSSKQAALQMLYGMEKRFKNNHMLKERYHEYMQNLIKVTTVIDGTASATFLATRTLIQTAKDVSKQYLEAAEVIKRDFYMDDVSSGSNSIKSAMKLQSDLIKVLKDRGFILRKWFSNVKELMESVPLENRHDPQALVELIDSSIKTLGIYWNQKEDWFEFKVTAFTKNKLSKREVLSDIAKLFDPIGWLSPATNQQQPIQFETEEERRKSIRTMHITTYLEDIQMDKALKKQSDLHRLLRITSFILRWLPKNRHFKDNIPKAREISNALKSWIKFTQNQSFSVEINDCLNGDEITTKSKLLSLRPFLDSEGILRVGGRLRKSDLPYKSKHPIILPKKHHFTKLIIEQAHNLTLHGGVSLMSVSLSDYWIFGKTEQIKRVIKNCITCFPHRCKPQQQLMADLPRDRISKYQKGQHIACYIHEYNVLKRNNCNMVVSNVVLNALKNTPSCSEIYKCSRERCKYSCTRILPFLGVNTDTLKNDFGNLKLAIFMNFPDNEPKCTICKTCTCITRTFGDPCSLSIK
ncbi:hypothetical protein Bhyg_03352 [Pseudolycoriella hygida]|uniref:Peptidase aspartic putative domain-containing protein n=1 Tax=Pseudolycoriella hygida TaxID=35572 RepID=A0A9Q0S7F4_9DIPT|nr:hypothetical protein Bhyg_03352 [Pseudolycoriella hygida]